MGNLSNHDSVFLGRAFVPVTLALVAVTVITFVTLDQVERAFASAASIVAVSLLLRLTWDRRKSPLYTPSIATLTAIHLGVIMFFGEEFSRAAGAAYMFGAFIDALMMTAIVNFLARSEPESN